MKSIPFSILFSMLFSSLALASVKIGNGGLVAYCEAHSDKKIESIELPDFLEARFRWDLNLPSLKDKTPWKTQVENVLVQLSKRSPLRAQIYGEWLETFTADAKFVEGFELPSTNDAIYLPFPINCKVKQAIVQIDPEVPQDKRYYINVEIWKELSENQKAGLVMHELIYREALKNDFSDSKWVRYFNALLWSNSIATVDAASWAQLFTNLLKVDYFEWHEFKASGYKKLGDGSQVLTLVEQSPRMTYLQKWNIENFESGELVLDSAEQIQSITLANVTLSGSPMKSLEMKFPMASLKIREFSSAQPQVEVNFIRNGDFQSSRRLLKDWNYDGEDFTYGFLARPGEQNRDALLKLRHDASSKLCQKIELPQSTYNLKFEIQRSQQSFPVYFEILDTKMKVLTRSEVALSSLDDYQSVEKKFQIPVSQTYYLCISTKAAKEEAWVRVDDFNLVPIELKFKTLLAP